MLLLEKVFDVINRSGLDYCIQNKYDMMPEEIPSDIDMMYRGADEDFLDNLVSKIAEETGLIITQKICQGYFEYTYIISYPCPREYFQLQLDFYRAISRRGYLNIMPAEDMLESKRFYKCFYIPDYYAELKYMWIRRTIKKDLSYAHIKIAKRLFNLEPEGYKNKLVQDFGIEVVDLVVEILESGDAEIFYKNIKIFNNAAKKISSKNLTIKVIIKYLKFIITTLIPKRLFHSCGISIAFLSPDGGGKSTIINMIKDTVSGSFYGVDVIYMRPRLFKNLGHYNIINPINEAVSNTDPHGKRLHNPIKSLIRYFFYNTDYILGTWFKINKKKIQKRLVIFDRYYYDYFVDMKRYQFNLPQWFPRLFAWSIPKPNLIYILDADAEVFFKRKQELPIHEITRQSKLYRNISKKYNNVKVINVDRSICEITDEITADILSYQEKRTAKIMN